MNPALLSAFSETTSFGRILVVDDEPANVRLLDRILRRAGYLQIHGTTDPFAAHPLFVELSPDLVLLDLNMPGKDGFAVLDELRPLIPPGTYVPILVLTGAASPDTKQRALSSGAKDFLSKPFEVPEVLLRIRNLLETRSLYLQLQGEKTDLEERVRERTAELEAAQVEILDRLGRAAEFRDDDTGQHAVRVAVLAARIAEALGLTPAEVSLTRRAAPMHDVGKISIPDSILLKPGRFTPEEFARTQAHTTTGGQILAGSPFPVLRVAEQIARCHHERWDGTGYPEGLAGEAIPLPARILSVADVWDALTHERPYKRAWSEAEALQEVRAQSGHQFDPAVVTAFLRVVGAPDGSAREATPFADSYTSG